MRRTLAAAGSSLVVALGLMAGCTADAPRGDGGDGVALPGLTGELTRYRRDEALRQLQVKLGQPDGEAPAAVLALRLVVPGYSAGPTSEVESQSRPGAVVDLPVTLGEPDCPEPGAPTNREAAPPGDPVAVVTVGTAAGPRELELELGDPDEVGPQTWSRECSARAAVDAAPAVLGRTWTRSGSGAALVASGELVVGPVAPGRAVTVLEVLGTTLFSTTVALPVDVAAGKRAVLPLTVAPARCDPHAVAESKRGYAFGVRVSVDGGEPLLVTVEPAEPARLQLEAVLLERCELD